MRFPSSFDGRLPSLVQPFSRSMRFAPLLRMGLLCMLCAGSVCQGKDADVPHNQDAPPGPALSPAEAIAKMQVPPGFSVRLVASEPLLVNPVAMTFDERGRVWVTESFEYPRREPGPGKDRVKILEDTDRDGLMDKATVFADGLNIPSGIALGHGGVWVANSPDILFLQDTNGDDVADTREVVVTGFGRDDTHELPNSLTWGPDGWLYGLNGVFNPGRVEHQGKVHEFTCTLFRIHPKTRAFELFCQGTSNPWGVAFDTEGQAFISACVIDHLWHLAEGAYYQRQGGPYPPYTWSQRSIVNHKHQKAAYCGIHYVTTAQYPPEFRNLLYMGNIHGNCINVDGVEPRGSTYFGTPRADFLTANDAWFMPVVQKEGPDGSLWILDWYDRYHCYQDANRDPAGIDRGKGRLYRVTYDGTAAGANAGAVAKSSWPAQPLDLSQATDDVLFQHLFGASPLWRDLAKRLLAERGNGATLLQLEGVALDRKLPRERRLLAFSTRVSAFHPPVAFLRKFLVNDEDPALTAQAVRAVGNHRQHAEYAELDDSLRAMVSHPSPVVQLAVTSAIAKTPWATAEKIQRLLTVANTCGEDTLLPHLVWQQLLQVAPTDGDFALAVSQLRGFDASQQPGLLALLPRVFDRILGIGGNKVPALTEFLTALLARPAGLEGLTRDCLSQLSQRMQSGEITDAERNEIKARLEQNYPAWLAAHREDDLQLPLLTLAVLWGDKPAQAEAFKWSAEGTAFSAEDRLALLAALVSAARRQPELVEPVTLATLQLARGGKNDHGVWVADAIANLGRLSEPSVASRLLAARSELGALAQTRIIDLMCQRQEWAHLLLKAIERGEIPREAVSASQARLLMAQGDAELAAQVEKVWGKLRSSRNPAREQIVLRMRAYLRNHPGDATRGQAAFDKVCGQCHKLYGRGQEVGPELTLNGRNSFEQLVSNVFDPSLVIGAAYQSRTIHTTDGRVLSGLLVEDTPQRVTLKLQGGKTETVARDDVETLQVSELSLMPENLEDQLSLTEIADLFALLVLDRPPTDPAARRLGDIDVIVPRHGREPEEFKSIVDEVAPGFVAADVGDAGVELLEEYEGERRVMRTHPLSGDRPALLRGTFEIPAGKRAELRVRVGHHPEGDWVLEVKLNGKPALQSVVGGDQSPGVWQTQTVDLTPFAGSSLTIEVSNGASGWNYEDGYWGPLEVLIQNP